MVDRFFYDSPVAPQTREQQFVDGRDIPAHWRLHQKDVWTVLSPADAVLPLQGWKIHVAATLDNAVDVLDAVWDYCISRDISFKFLADRVALLLRNSKYADRSGSGKFVTIYPVDGDQLEQALTELGPVLDGLDGPYILSDARWGKGPLHVRFGGFAERYCRVGGELILAMAEPSGRLVPDRRNAGFIVPPWVQVPRFLEKCVAGRRDADTLRDFPFQVEKALHHSNGGGVYLATDTRSGRTVVLKEARPFAGIDAHGQDAVQRMERERAFLEKLNGTGVTPELYEVRTCWEHRFLVEEYVEGPTLGQAYVARFPLIHPDFSEADVADYARWALDVLDKIERAVHIMHQAGIVFGDLHPHNIVLRPDGEVRFLDLELASYAVDNAGSGLGAPGYSAPDGRTGADTDLYAVASLRLALFLPVTAVLPLDPAKARQLAGFVTRRFPVPADRLAGAVDVLTDRRPRPATPGPDPVAELADGLDRGEPDWPALRASIRHAILASATPERTDRLFPGDIEQFTYNGIGLAYGAAGVLYALARCGAGRYPQHEQWLLDAVHRGQHNGLAGFYDGLHGVAYALAELGRLDDALEVLDLAGAAPLESLSTGLFGGVAGVGLNLLHFAALTGDRTLLERAIAAGERLSELDATPELSNDPVTRPGFLHGPSGQALLHIRLFEATGEPRFLAFAETALGHDLARCVAVGDGTMQMDEGWRVMPYLATGSAGVGLVLDEFLRHRDNERFGTALAQIRRAAEPEFIIGCGLFNGRTGLMAFLARLREAQPDVEPVIERHLRRLVWHLLSLRGNAVFPGDQLMRLSMDLATGSAGVLLALTSVLDKQDAVLPFLNPLSDTEGR